MSKKIIVIVILIFTTLLITILWCKDTKHIDFLVKDLFLRGEKSEYISEEAYKKFYYPAEGRSRENAQIKLDLKRKFCMHNLFDGYILYEYSFEVVKNNKVIMGGESNNFYVRIKKVDGKWNIIDINDKP